MSDATPQRTGRQLLGFGTGFVACTLLVALWVEWHLPGTGARWAAVSGVGVVGVVAFARRHADRNRPTPRDGAFDSLGVANALTLFRGVLAAFLVGLFVVPSPLGWFPSLLYGSVAALDAVDGVVARARNRATLLGAWLDMNVDAAGILAASVVGVAAGSLPPWYLAVGAARYLFVLGAYWRRRRGRPVFDLPHSTTRRTLAGAQMATTAILLAPVLPRGAAWTLATLTMVPFLSNFVVDWLVVTGRREAPLP